MEKLKKLNQLKQLEKQFSQNDYCGDLKKNAVFSYKGNHSYVCLTAPHATNSTVHKHLKKSDWFTGSIVQYLGKTHHLSYIVRNKYVPRKCMISSFIFDKHLEKHYFLDIHAMKDRPFDLAVGIGYCSIKDYEKELSFIKKLCKKYKLNYVINHPSYTGQPGLTGRLQRKLSQANVLQLEWTGKYRDFYKNPKVVFNVTLPFIEELALYLNGIHKNDLPYSITARYGILQKIKNRLNWIKNSFLKN